MNRSFLTIATIGLLLSTGARMIAAAAAQNAGPASSQGRHWTADNSNGTYSNPLFNEEFEDPDIIRVGDDYYLAGTTMHMMPGVQIMHSKDLVNWQLVGYAIGKLDLGPAYRLEGGNIYGRGIWAPSLRYHNGTFLDAVLALVGFAFLAYTGCPNRQQCHQEGPHDGSGDCTSVLRS